MGKFEKLLISEVKKLTDDSVSICFDIDNKESFNFKPGQYLTVKQVINEEEIRRAYSICSASNKLEIGVRRIDGGKMSSFLTTVKQGDFLEVTNPNGNFTLSENRNIVGICAGSGITPILSMIKSKLKEESSFFTLIYGNKTKNTTMFYDELKELEDLYSSNFKIHWIFSQEKYDNCLEGRINKDNLEALNLNFENGADYYICGPGEFIDDADNFLQFNGVNSSSIHFERFTSKAKSKNIDKTTNTVISNVTVIIDEEEFNFKLSSNDESLLDASVNIGADVPFACKGGVCCTCKAKVIEGEVRMSENFSLSDEEVKEGYILACQSHPISENIIVDFDEI